MTLGAAGAPILARRLAAGAVALMGAAGLGIAVSSVPLQASMAVAAAIAVACAGAIAPRAVLLLGLLTLAVAPQFIYDAAGAPMVSGEVLKASLLLLAAPFVLWRGLRLELLLPVGAYVALLVVARIGGTPTPGLTLSQSLSTLAALTLAWILMATRWRRADQAALEVAALIPVVSVVAGLVLQVAGLHDVLDTDPSVRLQGAMIPAYLGASAAIGTAAALLLWKLRAAPWAGGVTLLNVAITGATVSRASMLAVLVLTAPVSWRFLGQHLASRRARPLRLVAALGAGVIAVALVAPMIQQRNEQVGFANGRGAVQDDFSSGRLSAWPEFYAEAKDNLFLGHGLGATAVTSVAQQGFKAVHNEYLRLLIEGGLAGGLLVVAALVVAIALAIRRAPPSIRPELVALAVATALYSAVDNTLAASQYAVVLGVVFGVCTAIGQREERET